MPANSPFQFHANAHALSGYIQRPIHQMIEAQAGTTLSATGGHERSHIENFQFRDFVSFKRGYSHVSASDEKDEDKTAHSTLVTATVEGLNILDIVTADRIVARLSSSNISGDDPKFSVVGSKFENLQIGGYECKIELDHDLDERISTFAAVRREYASNPEFRKIVQNAPLSVGERRRLNPREVVRYSLVKEVRSRKSEEIFKHGNEGHSLVVPGFGTIYFAELEAELGRKSLTMLRVELGSPVGGRLVVSSVEAGSRVEPKRSTRYANATLFHPVAAQPLDPQSSLSPGDVTRLRLDIGPLSAESQVTPAFPDALVPSFPDPKLPADIDLDVMVSSTDFAVAPDADGIRQTPATIAHGRFFLPGDGSRATTPEGRHYLNFYLRAPEQPGQARCRTGYYYRNVLVQSQQLIANVGQSGGFQITTDFTLSDDLTNLESFPERPRISILTNANGDGTHQIVLRKPRTKVDSTAQGKTFGVRETKIGNIVKDLRAILQDRAPTECRRSPDMLRDDLAQLAPKGRELWRQVPAQDLDTFAPLEKDPASYVIQVSRPTTSSFVFPWALIYDIPLTDSPAVCELVAGWDGLKPLVSDSQRECPYGPHEENVLCPFGFWGFRYSIDQLASTNDSVFEINAPDEWDFVVAETQYGIDLQALSDHVDRLRTIVRKRFPRVRILEGKNKNEIRGLLGHDLPIVYFYCHGEKPYDAAPDTYLGVGMNESIKATELQDWVQVWRMQKKRPVWNAIRPLVFVNACHSLEIHPTTLVSYLDAFVGTARAAGVIGTEVRVSQDLAMQVAEKFFDLLLVQEKTDNGKSRPLTVDEALRKIRLDYLAHGNLLGLVYTPYCWAELCVTH